ncbi:8-demethyl-8-(2-methoxy-alpha-L-rhamnosyl)-tetracenomycin-C 3'-O-methyltransferase [Colletotrichum spaethianum]|uniref:8-demethyl-8-(2-methoxy-alpha-L-rhamnosyl)-tetracenomycin-C 3'-O-methyltransferase n=1 Tax=Colletotrichum spaethianum TaxID=700344 RepID=A0AA37L9J7_9PEZI|nr:8-demethyl-8-(2-methoxy-alpha-L-rhamnosyl)-tetracenomycin-C 3'-O-methyltransferase [Colletotrichum spaethianum]GKT44357.1 8-demethyl-8-(2-methoxy-alpha-L-rhamnosyl)-tetracenomycin-C 3'-O-methyltransferase [Colletotrichum spaethianum]
MIQKPRYLSALLVGATILLLLATLRITGDEIPEVINSANPWSRPPKQHDGQQDTQHEGALEVAAAAKKPIFGGKNHDERPTFTDLAMKSGTDKVTTHNYGFLYDKYLAQFRDRPVRMIEIGLGCGMPYGPGASYPIWTTYFPKIELNIVEYDERCGSAWAAKNPEAVLFFGDQSSVPFLRHVGTETTADGLMDIIVDDGGHTMSQQITSLQELWPYLRHGGAYFIEDLQTSFLGTYGGDETRADLAKKTAVRWIHELVDDIMSSPVGIAPKNAWSSEIASIDCMAELCVLTKKEQGAR